MADSPKVKVTTYVPKAQADAVREAVGKAGGGRIGLYSFCSFTVSGTGRFVAAPGAHPAAGEVGGVQQVTEERIEFICYRADVRAIVDEIRRVHPYEVVPVDVTILLSDDEL